MSLFKTITAALLLISASSTGQDSIHHRIILAGDAGKLINGRQPELELVKSLFDLKDSSNTIVYLGDNIYPKGLPPENAANYPEKKGIMDSQIDLVKGMNAKAFMIPGNHDWMQGRRQGLNQLLNQANYVKSLELPNVFFLPERGCPGPVEVELTSDITMIVIDSQWWLQRENRPGAADCECGTEDEIVVQLKDLLYRNRNKLVLFATHHPFKTYGEHGGYFRFRQHIFPLTELNPSLYIPLPVLGSIYPFSRSWFGNIQDVRHPEYKDYIRKLDPVLSTHPYVVRVSGHEHALEYIIQNDQHYIVSGAASKHTQIRKGPGSQFDDEGTGFAVLEVLKNGKVWLKFFSSRANTSNHLLYAAQMKQFMDTAVTKENFTVVKFPDSSKDQGAPYYKAGSFKTWLFGSNYRDEWTTDVQARVFNISKEKGGLKPIKRGGGFQSKSLRLEDASGKQYVVRSVEKFPDRTLPEEFRRTFVKDIIVDGVSASYPYAALSIPVLASAAGVPHANPELVYIPDDPALLQYRSDFANGLYIFEEREPGEFKKTMSSADVFEDLQKDNDARVNQRAVLKARVLDMFIMDFDRHEDQWRWADTDKGKEDKLFVPIPRDRDQPFFINNGFIPGFISRPWILPKFQGFRPHAKNIKTFNFNARYFDRSFLSALSKSDWEKEVEEFLPRMTDDVVEQAMSKQPAEIKGYKQAWITETLKARRAYLMQEMLDYYTFLAKEVDVVGSDKREMFEVNRTDSGSVLVKMYKINKEGARSSKLFERNFLPGETKEIRLWGQGGADRFTITGGSAVIKIRIIGGGGRDSIVNAGTQSAKTIVYDQLKDTNYLEGSFVNKLSEDPHVNDYNRKAYRYNILAPFLYAAYNPDDGVFLGFSLKNTRHGFRKEPHKIVHQFRASYAIATGAYNFRYGMDAVNVIGKADFVFNANISAPDYTQNFFGIGNETVFDKDVRKIRYYRSRFNMIQGTAMLRFNPLEKFSVSTGPVFQHYWINQKDNVGKFISDNSVNGLDSSSLYKAKTFLGWQLEKELDNRNNEVMPSRGAYWRTYARAAIGLNDYTSNIAQIGTDLSFFLSFSRAADFVIGVRLGGGINFGKYEFFQAQYLSGLENLRGYRKFRFGGDKMLFNNIDLRIRLADFESFLLPGSIGLVVFHDVGRVWVSGENSSVWHNGYGGGIWIAPAGRYVLTFNYGHSKDGGIPFVTLGFQF